MPIKSFLARRDLGQAQGSRLPGRRGRAKMAANMAPRVVIGKPPSWRRRAMWLAGALLLGSAVGFGLYLAGQRSAGYDSISARDNIARLRNENAELRAQSERISRSLDNASSQLRLELAARQGLEEQVRRMEEERGRLSQDLALFENLFPTNSVDGTPAIRGFRIEPVDAGGSPASWRYRVLVMRGGQPKDEFNGEFRLTVRYRLDNRDIDAANPNSGNVASSLRFRTYQRIEGSFQAPKGAKLLGAKARVEENGKLVSESTFRP